MGYEYFGCRRLFNRPIEPNQHFLYSPFSFLFKTHRPSAIISRFQTPFLFQKYRPPTRLITALIVTMRFVRYRLLQYTVELRVNMDTCLDYGPHHLSS